MPVIHRVPQVTNRRDLDPIIREIYDAHSSCGERMARGHYAMLVQGGANSVHKFGEAFVPGVKDGVVHIITDALA